MAAPIAEIVAGAIGGLGNIGIGIANTVQQQKLAEKNYQLQKEQLEYNKYFSENQHSIAAKDLMNAGLSKTLAAGSANTMQSMAAPQQQAVDWSQINPLAAISQMANLASTVAGARLASEQANTQKEQQAYLQQQTSNAVLDGFLKSFNNSKLDERFAMEKGNYHLGFADSLARNFNIFKRLEMDNLLNQAKIKNLDQSTANAALEQSIAERDFRLAKDAGVPYKGRGFYGNLVNDLLGFFGTNEPTFSNVLISAKNAVKRKIGVNSGKPGGGHYR